MSTLSPTAASPLSTLVLPLILALSPLAALGCSGEHLSETAPTSSGGASSASTSAGAGGAAPDGNAGATADASGGSSAGSAGQGGSTPSCVDSGTCAACTTAADCSAPRETCYEAACTDHVCSVVASKQGTVVALADGPSAPTCQKTVCDGAGRTTRIADPAHLPADDGSGCTTPTCDGDSAGYRPLAAGTSCGVASVCNGAGKCGDCAPGAARCDANTVSTCNSEGAWEAGLGCGAESPVCSDGACSALSSLVIGYFHTCALLNDGSVRCWGRNQYGQVGTPILDGLVLQPTRVDGLPKVVSLTAGLYHTCALDELGQAWCWGADSHGQLGKGTQGDGIFPPTIFSSVPTVAKTTARLAQLCAGGTHTCALTAAGEVLCWGGSTSGATGLPSMGDPGQQGFPQAANSVPIQGATGLYCGEEFTCALGSTGLYCWGDNMFGELTDASLGLTHADPPHPIKASVDSGGKTYDIDFSMTLSLALGGGHGCALVFPFGFVCWGSGVLGQLADGGTSDAPTLVPADVFNYGVSLTSANYKSARVVAGGAVSCVLVPGDQVACVGADDSGQMGDGNTQPPEKTTTIVEPKGVTKGATFLATSGETSCAIHQGDVVCWGRNTSGETGIGSSSGFVAAPSRVVW